MTAAAELQPAVEAIAAGRFDDAIASLEALADHGVDGTGVAFDRGIAYASRARGETAHPGDYGHAAHAFEEVLRRDPHDREARANLDAVRREIASRDAHAGGRTSTRGELVATTPVWREIVVSAPGNAWAGLTLTASLVASLALAARPRLVGGARLFASTAIAVSILLGALGATLGLGARWLHLHLHEAIVVAPRAQILGDDRAPIGELHEGERVDVVEERASETRVATELIEGWVARDSLRPLPRYRP